MRKTLFLLFGSALILSSKVYAYDDGDFQVWNTNAEECKITDKSKITLEEEFRWADNANIFYYHHYDLGFSYVLKKYLSVGGGYRHVYELKRGKFKPENEPYLTATFSCDFLGFKFEDRNRLEYRHFDYQTDSWRYRSKFTIKLPWKLASIQPYVADEIFVGFAGIKELNQNRFSSGLGINLTRNVKGEIYYMLQSSKSAGNWVDANILGTKIKIAF
jgi:hypothetical protein